MRGICDSQTLLELHVITPGNQKQWESVSKILDAHPSFAQDVWDDLHRNQKDAAKRRVGAKGLTADQILRFALVKTIEGLDYRALAERVDDSSTFITPSTPGNCGMACACWRRSYHLHREARLRLGAVQLKGIRVLPVLRVSGCPRLQSQDPRDNHQYVI